MGGAAEGVGGLRRACVEWAFLRAVGNHEDEKGGMTDSGSRRVPLTILQGMDQQRKAGHMARRRPWS